MPTTRGLLKGLVLLSLTLSFNPRIEAVLTIVLREVGESVIAQHAGTIDLTGLTFDSTSEHSALLHPQYGSLFPATGASDRYYGVESIVFSAFGPDRGTPPQTFELADESTGDPFGVGSGFLFVPRQYLSEKHLSGSSVFFDETIESLELTPGVYVARLPEDLLILIIGNGLVSGELAKEADFVLWPSPAEPGPAPGPTPDPDPTPSPEPPLPVEAIGTIPNKAYAEAQLFQKVSPVMGTRHQNQPGIINGYLFLAGNAEHEIWDISEPANPVFLSEMISPDRFGEAESHQITFAKYPVLNSFKTYAATTSGKGVDFWDLTAIKNPIHVGKIELAGVNYGDSTEAVWGLCWQGDYLYVGGTNTGLHIVDASDPTVPRLVRRVPNPVFGGIPAGPVFAMGNVLVITTPKNTAGVATLDISDPSNPVLLDYTTPGHPSYIGGFYGRKAYLQRPFRAFDVWSNPRSIKELSSFETPLSEYMSFDNNHLFLGSVSESSGGVGGVFKYEMDGANEIKYIGHIAGRENARIDDQFSLPVGNLLVVADDKAGDGAWLAVHDTQIDTHGPEVLAIFPKDEATGIPVTSRVGISFSDQIELGTVSPESLIVRPLGGDPVSGKWGCQQTIVSFWPDEPLEAEVYYEIVLPAGGISDLVGNGIAYEFRSTFRTGSPQNEDISEDLKTKPVEVGMEIEFEAGNSDVTKYEYAWDFGDGSGAKGPKASHQYARAGRFGVVLTVSEIGLGSSGQRLEAEQGIVNGAVRAASARNGYSGSGYLDYPNAFGSHVKASWQFTSQKPDTYHFEIRYANGTLARRPLDFCVNGKKRNTLQLQPTGGWESWETEQVRDITLDEGFNVIELVASARSVGPNIDYIQIASIDAPPRSESTVLTQIVHRPLTGLRPTRSSSVVVDETGGKVWLANPDSNTVSALSLANMQKILEVSVGLEPKTLALDPSGFVWVANQDSADISVLRESDGALIDRIKLPRGSRPFGVAFTPDGAAALATLEGTGQLVKIDPASRNILQVIDLGPDSRGIVPKLRGIAITADSETTLVTRFISPDTGGEVYEINLSEGVVTNVYRLGKSPLPDTPDSGRGIPNYLNAVAISPDGLKAWIPSKQDNIDRGVFRDGLPLTHDSTVRPIVSQIDLIAGSEDLDQRIDLNDAEMPYAIATSGYGDLLFVAVQGSNAIDVRDAYSGESIAGFTTGRAPQGLALDSKGRLYVQNFLSRSASVFDVSGILSGEDNTAILLREIDLVDKELLRPEVLLGKRIFYNARDPRMSFEGYLSCAACHLDGGDDGRVWDFTDRGEGFRNTPTLRGRSGLGHGNLHWTANFDEIQDFENEIRSEFGGTGFLDDAEFEVTADPLGAPKIGLSSELDALAAYVSSLADTPESPYRSSDGSLTDAAKKGRELFNELDCRTCHSGPEYTDGLRHDVGTIHDNSGKGISESLVGAGFESPTLKGIWNTAPYLHNGDAATLFEVLRSSTHGNAANLDQAEMELLVAYLLQIDDNE